MPTTPSLPATILLTASLIQPGYYPSADIYVLPSASPPSNCWYTAQPPSTSFGIPHYTHANSSVYYPYPYALVLRAYRDANAALFGVYYMRHAVDACCVDGVSSYTPGCGWECLTNSSLGEVWDDWGECLQGLVRVDLSVFGLGYDYEDEDGGDGGEDGGRGVAWIRSEYRTYDEVQEEKVEDIGRVLWRIRGFWCIFLVVGFVMLALRDL